MPGPFRKSTAGQVVQFKMIDSADFKSAKSGLTIGATDTKLIFEAGTTQTSKNSGGATEIGSTGVYYMTLDATDTATVGRLHCDIGVTGALPYFFDSQVLPAAVWDSLYSSSGGTQLTSALSQQTDVPAWNEPFPYSDGAIKTVGAPTWVDAASDPTGSINVTSNQLSQLIANNSTSYGAMASHVLAGMDFTKPWYFQVKYTFTGRTIDGSNGIAGDFTFVNDDESDLWFFFGPKTLSLLHHETWDGGFFDVNGNIVGGGGAPGEGGWILATMNDWVYGQSYIMRFETSIAGYKIKRDGVTISSLALPSDFAGAMPPFRSGNTNLQLTFARQAIGGGTSTAAFDNLEVGNFTPDGSTGNIDVNITNTSSSAS